MGNQDIGTMGEDMVPTVPTYFELGKRILLLLQKFNSFMGLNSKFSIRGFAIEVTSIVNFVDTS